MKKLLSTTPDKKRDESSLLTRDKLVLNIIELYPHKSIKKFVYRLLKDDEMRRIDGKEGYKFPCNLYYLLNLLSEVKGKQLLLIE